jgi:hypothetical protein
MSAVSCPVHGTPLSGGPIQYECRADDGHIVRAADIDHEYHPTVTR